MLTVAAVEAHAELDAALDRLHLIANAPAWLLPVDRLRAALEHALGEVGRALGHCIWMQEEDVVADQKGLDRPDLAATADHLRHELPAIREEVDLLLAESSCGMSVGAVRRGAIALVRHVRRHYAAEEALTFRSACEDLGTGD